MNTATGRRALASQLRSHRTDVAAAVTDEFLRRHPGWLSRHGEAARLRCLEEVHSHMDFLAGAVQGGASSFTAYACWTERLLAARGIAPACLVENLEQIAKTLEPRLSPAGHERVAEIIASATAAVRSGSCRDSDLGGGAGPALQVYVDSIISGNRQAALDVALELLGSGVPVEDVYCNLLQSAQYELGRRWQRNEISVSTEHMATAVTQFVVAQLYTRIPIPKRTAGRAIMTGVEGEMHQLGSNMVADMLEADGWNVRFLGTQLPHRDILGAIEEHQPTLVGISATMQFNLPAAIDLAAEIRRTAPPETRILVGGGAFRAVPELWRSIGADGYAADLKGAVALARQLTAATPRSGPDPAVV